MKVIDKMLQAIRSAAVFNPEVQVAPSCILWPDKDRQWETVIPRLMAELPELFVLGEYEPDKRTGPAIWLRCVIADKANGIDVPRGKPPILYLPGVSRQDLRAVENCPDYLKPLAELQYRGVIWSQINAKDWTILAFLKSDQGGLGLDVAQDNEAKSAMQVALYRILDEDIEILRDKRLDKDFFNTLLTGGDPIRDLLQWLDQAETFRHSRGDNEWKAFVEICQSQLAFNPDKEGGIAGAAKLAAHEGPWHVAWERYCEAPKRYPNIPEQIRKTTPPHDLFSDKTGWPQWNEEQEKSLRNDLLNLENEPAHKAGKKIKELEMQHKERRGLVWNELGHSPLACALEYLSKLAETTEKSLAAGTTEDLLTGFCASGWLADDAVVQSLSCIEKHDDCKAVTAAIRAVYLPWAEESARYLQSLVENSVYPGGTINTAGKLEIEQGVCLLFVDGLRYDVGKRLSKLLIDKGYEVEEKPLWAALPSVTATGKVAVSPVRHKLRGEDTSPDFEPCVAATGQSLKGGYIFKKLLADAGWKIYERSENGDVKGNAWCECGNIDHEGHERGWKLAKQIKGILEEISDRVDQLIDAGWRIVRIVTDHGWLLMPGGLPKVDLPKALVENRWGRCAALKPGGVTQEKLYPWFWNPNHSFALAGGISCYKSRLEYVHGGLSLQECLTLEIVVAPMKKELVKPLEINDIIWKGLRCSVAAGGNLSGLMVDIRTMAGNPSSSVVLSPKAFKENGISSLVVENEGLEGSNATIVIVNENKEILMQFDTVIGGGMK